MKFGKEFRNHLEETLPEWRDKFLCYKPLKKLIKHRIPLLLDPLNDDDPEAPLAAGPWAGLEDWFVRILDEELDKFNDFYVDKEEEFIIRLQELKERIEELREIKSEDSTSRSVSSEEMMEIRKAFVTIHGEMVLLKNYSSLNFAGLVKILKKYDKRTGALLSLPFTRRALHQPFFTTEPLTGLVRECESNMELLFPLEAEVIESASPENMRRCPNTSKPNVASAQEDKSDLYRSTMAAMKAIRSLRKASSTYNPLSLAQFFHAQDDDDGSGVVTAEDSGSDSHTTSQYKEADQENVDSDD